MILFLLYVIVGLALEVCNANAAAARGQELWLDTKNSYLGIGASFARSMLWPITVFAMILVRGFIYEKGDKS